MNNATVTTPSTTTVAAQTYRLMNVSSQLARRCDGVPDDASLRVEERPVALHLVGNDAPAVPRVARDDVKVEVEDRLEGSFAVADEDVDPLAAHAGASQGSRHVVTHRPDMSAGDSLEVFEAHRVLAGDDEEMARYDGVEGHEDHHGLVLVDEARFRLAGDDGAEDARLLRSRLRFGHDADGASRPD